MPMRNQYVQNRVAARMQQRGEKMILRSVSMIDGPEPFRNPPDLSDDLVISAGSLDSGGQAFIGITGSTITGRLVAGDKLTVASGFLTVQTMPSDVMTDGDGVPLTDASGNPVFGTPVVYHADTLARGNAFPVVAVSGNGNPADLIGTPLRAIEYAADLPVFGWQMSREKMVALGWIELDSIGIEIAGKSIPAPQPKVNDQIIFNNGADIRSIMSVGQRAIAGVNFVFQVQAH
jgi:hypothetical protein